MDIDNLDLIGAQDVQESTAADDDGQQAGQDPAGEKAPEKPEQTPEERARQAEGRRIREREQRAYTQARNDMSAVLKRLGIENPETGEVIDSVDALEAYERDLSDKRLASGKATAEDMRRVVREAIREETRPAQQPDTREVDRQLAEIKAMDPEMTDLGAILSSDAGPKFREYVAKGLNFTDAYTLAARDKLAARAAGQKAAAARAAGKEHLSSTSTRGQGAVVVPKDVKEMYKLLMPEMSDDEIQKAYNADVKKYGG